MSSTSDAPAHRPDRSVRPDRPEPGVARPRAAVLYNPARVAIAKLRRAVERTEADAGWAPSLWIPTALDRTGDELVTEAVAAGVELIIAAGGDGTVRAVGSAMRGRPEAFAVVPAGTANLLARNAGIPLGDLPAAVQAAFTGNDHPIDLGLLEYRTTDDRPGETPFLVMTGFGVDADMVTLTDPVLKRRIGWVAYVGPIVRGLLRRDRPRVVYTLNGEREQAARLHSLFVGNCGTLTAGFRVLPDALIDDGLLDVLMVRSLDHVDGPRVTRWLHRFNNPVARMRRPSPGPAAPREVIVPSGPSTVNTDSFRYATATSLELRITPEATLQADGDEIGKVVWARMTIDPGALRLRLPASLPRPVRLFRAAEFR